MVLRTMLDQSTVDLSLPRKLPAMYSCQVPYPACASEHATPPEGVHAISSPIDAAPCNLPTCKAMPRRDCLGHQQRVSGLLL